MTVKDLKEQMNQCDGCRRRLPLSGNIHYVDGKTYMTCTARLYGFQPGDNRVILVPAGNKPSPMAESVLFRLSRKP